MQTVYENIQTFSSEDSDKHFQACSDVLKAIDELRTCLNEKQKSGNVSSQIAVSAQEKLDALANQTQAMRHDKK